MEGTKDAGEVGIEDGGELLDDPASGGYPTPLGSVGSDAVFVGRVRLDPTVEHGIVFWCVADNLRKGAATNAIQIAEQLIRRGKL